MTKTWLDDPKAVHKALKNYYNRPQTLEEYEEYEDACFTDRMNTHFDNANVPETDQDIY